MFKKTLGWALFGVGAFVSLTACTKPNAPTNENFSKAIKADMSQNVRHYEISFKTPKNLWGLPSGNKKLYEAKIFVKTPETKKIVVYVDKAVPEKEYQAELKKYNWLIQGGYNRWDWFGPNPPYPKVYINTKKPVPPTRHVSVPTWLVVHRYALNQDSEYVKGKAFCDGTVPDPLSDSGQETLCSIPYAKYSFDKILSSTQPAPSGDGRIVAHVKVLMRLEPNDFEKKFFPVSLDKMPHTFKMVLEQETNGWKVIESTRY